MKKILLALVLCLAIVSLMAAPVMAAKPAGNPVGTTQGSVYLYEKTIIEPIPEVGWAPLDGVGWGKFNYAYDAEDMISGVFNGKGLVADTNYTLVAYYGWPEVIALGNAVANGGGNVNIAVDLTDITDAIVDDWGYEYSGAGPGVKIWLVETDDLNDALSAMDAWNPTNYLFEGSLVQ